MTRGSRNTFTGKYCPTRKKKNPVVYLRLDTKIIKIGVERGETKNLLVQDHQDWNEGLEVPRGDGHKRKNKKTKKSRKMRTQCQLELIICH